MSENRPRPRPTAFTAFALSLLAAGALSQHAPAQPAGPLDLIPADALLCWHGRPFPDTDPAASQPSTLGTLIDLGTRIAGRPLDGMTRLTVRLVETVGLMIRYPHALAILDARAKPHDRSEAGRKVDQLRVALVVKSDGASEPFRRVIQKIVNEQTDAAAAVLERRTIGRFSYQELRDSRLPEWSVVAWGDIGDYFVLTLGRDVWPQVARVAVGEQPALGTDPWVRNARARYGETALLEIMVAIARIRERLDEFVDGRASDFFRAWHADDIDRAYWALGFEGRGLFCIANFEKNGRGLERVFADPKLTDDLKPLIPETARYAVYRIPMADMVGRFFSGLLATRSAPDRARLEQTWARVQSEQGIDAQRDVLANLGERWICLNHPPHPLRIPLAMTTLTEIRSNPQRVRAAVDALCSALQQVWDADTQPDQQAAATRLVHESDGLWTLQFGFIAGPAWVVTDRYLVTSWSPAALRAYLETAGPAAGNRVH